MLKNLTAPERQQKLDTLIKHAGYSDITELFQAVLGDSVCPAICTRLECNYTTDMEPDQRRGWCEACGANTVESALVLANLI